MKYFSLLLCTALLIAVAACNHEKTAGTETATAFSLDSAKAQIAASNAIYGDCFGKKDSVTFVNCYTEDACINPPGVPRMCGKAAVGAFFNEGVKMGIHQLQLTTDEVMGGKDGVVETGKYEVIVEGGISVEKGKFIVMWKEENGKWKMHRDVWNSDAAAPAPAK